MRTEGVGLMIQMLGGSCRVYVLFHLTFVRGSSTPLTPSQQQAAKFGGNDPTSVRSMRKRLTFRFW